MLKVADITNKNIQALRLINKDNLYKEVKIYKYNGGKYIYSITHSGKLLISGSTPKGPVKKDDLIYVFHFLTDKFIDDFKVMRTGSSLYLFENGMFE